MLSFASANAHLSFYLLFLLCMASLAASAPITYHRQPHLDSSFPYGKLADKLLNVNDVPYVIDNVDEDMVRVYPENHSIPFSSALPPIPSFEPKPPVIPINAIPNVGTKNHFSFVYRIPDIIKQIVTQEWNSALPVRWRTMSRIQ